MRVKGLAMMLSGLEQISSPSVELEQYATGGDLASRWLFDISAFGDLFDGCTVVDLGAGNGILGLGSLSLGASRAILVEADEMACDVAKSNSMSLGLEDSVDIIRVTIGSDKVDLGSADVVISNPPWGRQSLRADRPFIEEILSFGVTAHIMHSSEASHIEPYFHERGWVVDRYGEADFAIPAMYPHHDKKRGKTRAAFWRLIPPERRETLPDRS